MTKQTITRRKTTAAAKPVQSGSWRTYLLMAFCMTMLVGGFFVAGRLHFSSMDYGIKNSRLRKQVEELESQKRRLLLQREVALSPTEIKRAVTRLPKAVKPDEATPQMASMKKDPSSAPNDGMKPLIVRTVAVSAVRTQATTALARSDKNGKSIKVSMSAE